MAVQVLDSNYNIRRQVCRNYIHDKLLQRVLLYVQVSEWQRDSRQLRIFYSRPFQPRLSSDLSPRFAFSVPAGRSMNCYQQYAMKRFINTPENAEASNMRTSRTTVKTFAGQGV